MAQLSSTPKLAVLAALLACATAAPLYENTPETGYYGMRRRILSDDAPSSVSVASSAVAAACDALLADGVTNEFTTKYCDGVGAGAAVSATRTDSDGAMQTADSNSDSSVDPFAFLTLSTMTGVTTVATPLPTLAAPLGEASAPDNLFDYLDDANSVKQQSEGLAGLVLHSESDDEVDSDGNDNDTRNGDADTSESSSSSIHLDIIAHLNELVNSVKVAASPATALTSTLSLTQSVTRTAKSATALTATVSSLATPVTAAAASATDAALGSLFASGSDDSQSSDDNASLQSGESVQASQYDSADA